MLQQQLKQVADAVAISTLKTGSPVKSAALDASNSLIPRFLKTVPNNPIRGPGGTFFMLHPNPSIAAANNARLAIAYMNADEQSRAVCESIDRMSGRTLYGATFDAGAKSFALLAITGQAGCQSNGSVFIVFHKL